MDPEGFTAGIMILRSVSTIARRRVIEYVISAIYHVDALACVAAKSRL